MVSRWHCWPRVRDHVRRTHGIAFVAPLLGVWLIVSPWLVSGVSTSTGMILSNVLVGAVVVVLGAAGMAMAMTRRGNHR